MIVKGYSGIASHIRGPYCVKSIVELITSAKYTHKNEKKQSFKRKSLITHFRMENFLFKKYKFSDSSVTTMKTVGDLQNYNLPMSTYDFPLCTSTRETYP